MPIAISAIHVNVGALLRLIPLEAAIYSLTFTYYERTFCPSFTFYGLLTYTRLHVIDRGSTVSISFLHLNNSLMVTIRRAFANYESAPSLTFMFYVKMGKICVGEITTCHIRFI